VRRMPEWVRLPLFRSDGGCRRSTAPEALLTGEGRAPPRSRRRRHDARGRVAVAAADRGRL